MHSRTHFFTQSSALPAVGHASGSTSVAAIARRATTAFGFAAVGRLPAGRAGVLLARGAIAAGGALSAPRPPPAALSMAAVAARSFASRAPRLRLASVTARRPPTAGTGARRHGPARASPADDANASQPASRGFGTDGSVGPTEALIASLGEVSAADERIAKARVAVFGSNEELEKWKLLDAEVNKYPMRRSFKAMASADDGELAKSLVAQLNNIPGLEVDAKAHISVRPSAKGNYQSITLGPLLVTSGEQVIDVFATLKAEPRVRYVL